MMVKNYKSSKVLKILLIIIALTLILGRFVALDIERRSFQLVTEPPNGPTLFEIRHMLYNWEFLRIAFTPALKVTKVDYKYPCKSLRNEVYEGFMVEFRFLTYWGIPTPLHAYSACNGGSYGKVPKNGRWTE